MTNLQTNSEKIASVELLPQGAFSILTTTGEKVTGCFDLVVIDNFCERKGVDNYFAAIEKISVGMKLREYAELLKDAIPAFNDKTDQEILRWINKEFDGISEPFLKLVLHAVGRLGQRAKVKGSDSADLTDDDKKKELNGHSTDLSSASSSTVQE